MRKFNNIACPFASQHLVLLKHECPKTNHPPTTWPSTFVRYGKRSQGNVHSPAAYKRRPRRPLFLRVLSVGMGVTSSATAATQGEKKRTTLHIHHSPQASQRCDRTRTNAADLHASASEGAQGRLGTGAWGLALVAASAAQLDVQGSDAKNLSQRTPTSRILSTLIACPCYTTSHLAALSNILGSKHGSVVGSLITVSLHLHATCSNDASELKPAQPRPRPQKCMNRNTYRSHGRKSLGRRCQSRAARC